MAKNKAITKQNIISMYMKYVLVYNEHPKSVHAFAKANNFEESKFYSHFGTFEAVEKQVFNAFFENTITVLEKNKDYNAYDSRSKLLAFYFTFFETLTANRSYVVYALNKHKSSLKNLTVLTSLKTSFISYIKNMDIEKLNIKQEQIEKFQTKTISESAWVQLLVTLKFWLDDTSANFEKTDIFIEKSINTSFDILNVTPLKSIIDLGKFLFKEKIQMN